MHASAIQGLHSSFSSSRVVVFNESVIKALALGVVRSQLESNACGKQMRRTKRVFSGKKVNDCFLQIYTDIKIVM